jgi:hypothetical protein
VSEEGRVGIGLNAANPTTILQVVQNSLTDPIAGVRFGRHAARVSGAPCRPLLAVVE